MAGNCREVTLEISDRVSLPNVETQFGTALTGLADYRLNHHVIM